MDTNEPLEIPWWSTEFTNGEDLAVSDAVRKRHLSQGVITREFETMLEDYLNVRNIIAVTNGSSALLVALIALGVGPGDEVLVPNRTWIATAHAVHMLGGIPVFVDVEPDRPIMDLSDIEHRITSKTKAIIPVHMNGGALDITTLKKLTTRFDIQIVEDAAQALGSVNSNGAYLGTESLMGCYSLSVAKIISSGQGGFISSNDDDLANRIRAIRTHGVENTTSGESWRTPGFNFRFTDVLASIGIVQLNLLPSRIQRLAEIRKLYATELLDIPNLRLIPSNQHEAGPYIEVLVDSRTELIKFLRSRSIEARPFYPNLDSAPYWESRGRYVNSQVFASKGLYLPSGPTLDDDKICKVTSHLKSFFGTKRI
jgi:dTDP-4-amino-4,6-dideoxygalactose transaminase